MLSPGQESRLPGFEAWLHSPAVCSGLRDWALLCCCLICKLGLIVLSGLGSNELNIVNAFNNIWLFLKCYGRNCELPTPIPTVPIFRAKIELPTWGWAQLPRTKTVFVCLFCSCCGWPGRHGRTDHISSRVWCKMKMQGPLVEKHEKDTIKGIKYSFLSLPGFLS